MNLKILYLCTLHNWKNFNLEVKTCRTLLMTKLKEFDNFVQYNVLSPVVNIFSCARFYKPCSSCRIIQKWTGLAHLILMNLTSMISSFSLVVHLCVVLGVHFSQWSGNLKEWNGLQVLMTSNICERCFDKYFGARVIEGSTQHGT